MAGRILIMFDGTRGDLQPLVIAARALIEGGFDVMLSGPGDGKTMAKEFNVPFTRSRISAQKVQMDPKLAEAWLPLGSAYLLRTLASKGTLFRTHPKKVPGMIWKDVVLVSL
eukprot:symbB.v1.2.035009.t1/scaffold4621.1/size37356/3